MKKRYRFEFLVLNVRARSQLVDEFNEHELQCGSENPSDKFTGKGLLQNVLSFLH